MVTSPAARDEPNTDSARVEQSPDHPGRLHRARRRDRDVRLDIEKPSTAVVFGRRQIRRGKMDVRVDQRHTTGQMPSSSRRAASDRNRATSTSGRMTVTAMREVCGSHSGRSPMSPVIRQRRADLADQRRVGPRRCVPSCTCRARSPRSCRAARTPSWRRRRYRSSSSPLGV